MKARYSFLIMSLLGVGGFLGWKACTYALNQQMQKMIQAAGVDHLTTQMGALTYAHGAPWNLMMGLAYPSKKTEQEPQYLSTKTNLFSGRSDIFCHWDGKFFEQDMALDLRMQTQMNPYALLFSKIFDRKDPLNILIDGVSLPYKRFAYTVNHPLDFRCVFYGGILQKIPGKVYEQRPYLGEVSGRTMCVRYLKMNKKIPETLDQLSFDALNDVDFFKPLENGLLDPNIKNVSILDGPELLLMSSQMHISLLDHRAKGTQEGQRAVLEKLLTDLRILSPFKEWLLLTPMKIEGNVTVAMPLPARPALNPIIVVAKLFIQNQGNEGIPLQIKGFIGPVDTRLSLRIGLEPLLVKFQKLGAGFLPIQTILFSLNKGADPKTLEIEIEWRGSQVIVNGIPIDFVKFQQLFLQLEHFLNREPFVPAGVSGPINPNLSPLIFEGQPLQ